MAVVNKKPGLLKTLRESTEWFIPTGAVALVFVMLVPLPSFMLDLLLTFSIMASVLVLLTAIQILRPVQFSVFPSEGQFFQSNKSRACECLQKILEIVARDLFPRKQIFVELASGACRVFP